MSFAKSFYADQKPADKPQETVSPAAAAIPATTPIAEDPLTPAQIQEAIRIYRSVLSSSAPSSPVRQVPERQAVPERPAVHSNYYGGGPTDIPQSYLLNYTSSPSRAAPTPVPAAPSPQAADLDLQLLARLQALQIQQQSALLSSPVSAPATAPVEPTFVAPQVHNAAPKRAPFLQRMYDDEESGYCFNRPRDVYQDIPEAPAAPVEEVPTPTAPVTDSVPQETYEAYIPAPAQAKYAFNTGPSEYIGMANDNKFIYDAQKSLPASYAHHNSYTLVNSVPQAVIARPEDTDDNGVTTTEDVTQVPASPVVTSRFRGLIKSAQTPVQATAPIIVERIAEPPYYAPNNYGAFMPVNQMSMESEYQLPVLNDLASCIEHY
ncbi:unnamed protein product [Caenorhabditis sp. 36 PRJEB53466]|nr:unnamed protein product [Caenorhabditis sp. 36 PRJEB53466]